jgi:hypothetical protein
MGAAGNPGAIKSTLRRSMTSCSIDAVTATAQPK